MILPNKNITLSHSFLGRGAIVLEAIKAPQTVSSLWDKLKEQSEFNALEKYILTLDFLFGIGLIKLNNGLISLK